MTEIVDCVREHPSKWAAPGHWHFVLANSRPLPFVRWKGALSLREAPPELLDLLTAGEIFDKSAELLTRAAERATFILKLEELR